MRVERLPGIHHDMSCIVVSGTESTVIIDPGTAWYQTNLEARLAPHLEGRAPVTAILLTHRHYDACGAAPHLSDLHRAPIHIHDAGVAALAGADSFTTWASRYGSEMSAIEAETLEEGQEFDLGDGTLRVLHAPGHTKDGCVFHLVEKDAVICGDLVPADGHPCRTDMPTGNLVELQTSLERVRALAPKLLVCGRGAAVQGRTACDAVLSRHLDSVQARIDAGGERPAAWPKPAETCHWLTPEPPWNFHD